MSEIPAGTRAVEQKNAFPVYAVGLVWLVWALVLPLYQPVHFFFCALASGVVYLVLNAIAPSRTVYLPEKEIHTGNEEADELIKTGKSLLVDIANAANAIEDDGVRAKFAAIDLTCRAIIEQIARAPGAASSLRKFFNYYLPTLKKLADTYAVMEKQGVSGGNIGEGMSRISQMLDTMDAAFKRQLDALFSATTLDVTTDIAAMESLMAQEGLTEGQNDLNLNQTTGGNEQ